MHIWSVSISWSGTENKGETIAVEAGRRAFRFTRPYKPSHSPAVFHQKGQRLVFFLFCFFLVFLLMRLKKTFFFSCCDARKCDCSHQPSVSAIVKQPGRWRILLMNFNLWGRKQLINARDLMLSLTHSFPFSVAPRSLFADKKQTGDLFFFCHVFPFSLAASHETAQSEQLKENTSFYSSSCR